MNGKNLLMVFILIVMNHAFFAYNQPLTGGNDSNNGIVDCIVHAINLVAERKIAVEFADDSAGLVSEILEKTSIPIVLNSVEKRNQNGIEYRTSNDLLLLFKDVEVEKILKDTLWYGETRFLIITQDEEKVEEYFESFWKRKVINVFAIVKTNLSLYSFLPYRKDDCKKLEVIIVDACQDGQLREGGSSLGDPTRLKNMNGCPVNVSVTDVRPNSIFMPDAGRKTTSKLRGFEGNFMAEVAKIYNFRPNFKLAEDGLAWGRIHPRPIGTVGDLYLGVSDIIVGMLAPLVERYIHLDLPVNYNTEECATFMVPRWYGAKKADWLSIFILEFSFGTWILILFSFLMIAVNVWLINRYLRANWFGTKTEITLLLLSSCLGLPVNTPQYVSAKTSVTFWIVFSFIVTVAYKTIMASKLAVPPHDPDINTLDELLKSDLEFTGLQNMCQLLTSSDRLQKEVMKQYKATNETIENMVERIAGREKFAFLRLRSSFHYYSMINPKARGRIHVIDYCVYPYHPYALLRKFSPFTKKFNQILTRLEESGIMEMWRAQYKENNPQPTKPFFKLSIEQMFGIFCFLLFGYFVAFLSFAYELGLFFGVIARLSRIRYIKIKNKLPVGNQLRQALQ